MITVCKVGQCAGCMACVSACPRSAIHIEDSLSQYDAVIDPDICIGCDLCHRVCPQNHPLDKTPPHLWQQGWATDEGIRSAGASGGFASAIAKAFLKEGAVCGCVFESGKVGFKVIEEQENLRMLSGSRYVKSDPTGIHEEIRDRLKQEKKVLFIGLPCQVAGVKRFIGEALEKNLYTIDLICHGSPSPSLLHLFLRQYGVQPENLEDLGFRNKQSFQLSNRSSCFVAKGTKDAYMIAFLNGLPYTENCYSCQYAQEARVSDLTLGDSWGSELPESEAKKGISLALVQTEKGEALLRMAEIHTVNVNAERAKQFNHQLEKPSVKPQGRDAFFEGLKKGKKFNKMVARVYPKQTFKQKIKGLLIRTKIYR